MQGYIWAKHWKHVLAIDRESWPQEFEMGSVTRFHPKHEIVLGGVESLFEHGDANIGHCILDAYFWTSYWVMHERGF